MDGVESIGMPVSLPLLDAPGRPSPCTLRRAVSDVTRDVQGVSHDARRRDEQEKQIGRDFESVLLTKLFDQVQASIGDSGFDEEDGGSQQVRGLFWLHLARDVADKGGFGLWKDIYQYIKRLDGAGTAGEGINEQL
jgi:hypothetical protein